jgi:fimbrial chaperone protein
VRGASASGGRGSPAPRSRGAGATTPRRPGGLPALAACLGLLLPGAAWAGSFQIVPIPVAFEAGTKIAVLKVTNNGEERVSIQAEALDWGQDEIGSDTYAPAKDVVFFPRIFSLEKGEEKAVRVGYRGEGVPDRERTFRLILQELPSSRSGELAIRMALRLNVPIFVRPSKVVAEAAVERVWVEDGTLRVKVRNRGNSHTFVKKISATGLGPSELEVFSKEFRGWYVLAGASSTFFTELTEEQCRGSRTVKVVVAFEDATSVAALAPEAADCARPAAEGR